MADNNSTPALLYNYDGTLSSVWKESGHKLEDIPKLAPTKYLATYCYSVIAKQRFGIASLPAPRGFPRVPFFIRWRDLEHSRCGDYLCKIPADMSQVLQTAVTTSWDKMYADRDDERRKRDILKDCVRGEVSEDSDLLRCSVEVGFISDYKLLKTWDDFSKEEDFLIVEICGTDGLWRCGQRHPLHLSDRNEKADKALYIVEAFRLAGYKDVTKEASPFWENLQVTSCKMYASTGSWQDYSRALIEVQREQLEGKSMMPPFAATAITNAE